MHSTKKNKTTKGFFSPLVLLLSVFFINSAYAMDQCNTTQQCRTAFGNTATDCQNSRSNNSICICGSAPCENAPNPTPGTGMLGQVDKSKDSVFFFFDNKPDADDIQSQAGVGTMLRDPRFSGLNYWAVLGTTGQQFGAFLNSDSVMDLCLGEDNWVLSHPITSSPSGSARGTSAWNNALNQTESRALAILNGGGDIFIVEAGQSNFSADLVRRIRQRNSNINTRQRIHIYQHSTLPQFNERQTLEADLNYVMNNTDYVRVPNGNAGGNNSPQLKTNSGAQFSKAISLGAGAGACWREARRVANANNFNGNGHFENPSIEAGGFDFSDVVEFTFFTGFNGLRNVADFFNEFDNPIPLNSNPAPTATPTATPTPVPTITPAPFPGPIDQCNTTQQCRNIFGNSATDCKNSRSNTSICMCGSQPCGSLPNPNPTPTPTPNINNLLSNPGFESGNLNGWGGFGTRTITNDASAGSSAGRVTGVGSLAQVISGLTANTTYTYTAQTKTNAGNRAFFGVKNYGGAETANTVTHTSYQTETLTFTTGENNTSAQVYFFVANAGDVAFIDQASLVTSSAAPTPTPMPTIPNPTGAFQAQNGLVVVDLESQNTPNGWVPESGDGSIGGYINWQGGNAFGTPGNGTFTTKVNITNPGTYRFMWRSSIRVPNVSNTDHNDSWLRIIADNFFGRKGNSIVCPVGKLPSNSCSGSRPQGASGDGWLKVYRSGGSALDWSWVTSTSDNDAHAIFAEFDRAGVYDIQISGRSNDHGIDRFILFRDGNASNNVSQSFATNSDRPQSPRN